MPAGAQTSNPPQQQSTAAFCENVPDDAGDFDDIAASGFPAEIRCLVHAGITIGTSPGRYEPGAMVTRAQMATFIARLVDTANDLEIEDLGELPEHDGSSRFADVPEDHPHVAGINRLAEAGIVQGGPDGRPANEFGPSLPVTRAQLASFVNRAQEHLTGSSFASEDDFFTDDDDSQHEPNINGIASRGIVVGVSQGSYAPRRSATRGQMAAFLVRYLAVLHADEQIGALPKVYRNEAPDGAINGTGDNAQADDNKGAEVRLTDKSEGAFVACDIAELTDHIDDTDESRCFMYSFSSSDTFLVDGTESDEEGFLAELSPYDDVTGTYSREGESSFSLENEAPVPPSAVSAEARRGNSVTVSIEASETPSVREYDVHRARQDALLGCTAAMFASVGVATATATTRDATFVDGTVQPETGYCYRVFSLDDDDVSAEGTDADPVTTPAGEANTTGSPRAVAIDVIHHAAEGTGDGTGSRSRLDASDEIRIAFDRPMRLPAAGDAILIQAENTIWRIQCGFFQLVAGNNCTVGAGNVGGASYAQDQVITIVLVAGASKVTGPGTVPPVGAAIFDQRGLADAEGVPWDVNLPEQALNIGAGDVVAPLATAISHTDGGLDEFLDRQDVIELTFDGAMAQPDVTARMGFRGSDPDGTQANFSCNGFSDQITCVRDPENPQIIRVTINSSTVALQLPVTITEHSKPDSRNVRGFEDVAGNMWSCGTQQRYPDQSSSDLPECRVESGERAIN